MSLIAGLFGGVALAAIGRFTVVSVAGLSVVGAVAWRLARHRHRNGLDDRPVHLEGTQR
jgi:hypothetical protein